MSTLTSLILRSLGYGGDNRVELEVGEGVTRGLLMRPKTEGETSISFRLNEANRAELNSAQRLGLTEPVSSVTDQATRTLEPVEILGSKRRHRDP